MDTIVGRIIPSKSFWNGRRTLWKGFITIIWSYKILWGLIGFHTKNGINTKNVIRLQTSMKFLLLFPNLWFMILLIETAIRFSCITSYVFSDMDECTSNYHICDNNAVCQNTEGSYTCSWKAGYTGDGKICSGEWFGVLLIAFLLKDDDNDDDDDEKNCYEYGEYSDGQKGSLRVVIFDQNGESSENLPAMAKI